MSDNMPDGIEITPEMIEAGAEVMAGYDRDFDTLESIAWEVYRAMALVERGDLDTDSVRQHSLEELSQYRKTKR